MSGKHMTEKRLAELLEYVDTSFELDDRTTVALPLWRDQMLEALGAVLYFRTANAATNDLRVAERTRLSARITELTAEVIDLEQDENPQRVFLAEQEAQRLQRALKESNFRMTGALRRERDLEVRLAKQAGQAEAYRRNLEATRAELKALDAQFKQAIKDWENDALERP